VTLSKLTQRLELRSGWIIADPEVTPFWSSFRIDGDYPRTDRVGRIFETTFPKVTQIAQ
jgi:hypothetical protein